MEVLLRPQQLDIQKNFGIGRLMRRRHFGKGRENREYIKTQVKIYHKEIITLMVFSNIIVDINYKQNYVPICLYWDLRHKV